MSRNNNNNKDGNLINTDLNKNIEPQEENVIFVISYLIFFLSSVISYEAKLRITLQRLRLVLFEKTYIRFINFHFYTFSRCKRNISLATRHRN